MGADLYIKDLPREKQYLGFEVSKKAVDVGYFRDCYNSHGLFRFISSNATATFSWLEMARKKEWFNDSGEMTLSGALKFLNTVMKAKRQIDQKQEFYLDVLDYANSTLGSKPEYIREKLTAEESEEFIDWLDLLIRFLRLAIIKESNIIWSV